MSARTWPLLIIAPLVALLAALIGFERAARADGPSDTPGSRALLAGEEASGTPALAERVDAAALAGKRIRAIEVVTAGDRWRSSPALRSVRVGEIIGPDVARRAMRELLATGRFARANVEAIPNGDGVTLRVNALPRRIITTIKLKGGVLDEPITLEAADIGPGVEIVAPMIPVIAAKIEKLYAQRGYPSAKVIADTADTDDPSGVVLSLEVKPGDPRTVSERVLVIDRRVDPEVSAIARGYRVERGARLEESALVEADRDLAEALRKKGFLRADVRHRTIDEGKKTKLYVYALPGPRLVPAFDGNRAFDADQLTAALDLEKSPEARFGELTDRLKAFYVNRGFFDVEVSLRETGGDADAMHYLAFTVKEHRRARVVRRVFPCLEGEMTPNEIGREIDDVLETELPSPDTFSPPDPRVMAEVLGSKETTGGRGLPFDLTPASTYTPDAYERALKHVRDLVHSKGYLNAVVGPVTVVRPKCSRSSPAGVCVEEPPPVPISARCLRDPLGIPQPEPPISDAVTCRPDTRRDVECSSQITLRIPLALGPRTVVYDLAFDGNRSANERELASIAALPLGGPLSDAEREAARARVLDHYRRKGFAFADVRAAVELSPDRTRARVRFYVTERDRVTVSGFVVKGATRVDPKLVLKRLSLKEGRPYQQDLVRQSEERIATLGVFSSVSISLEDPDVPQKQKRVIVSVVEQTPQYIEPRIGFSSGEGLRFAFEYGHRNIGGSAISLVLRVQLGYLFSFLVPDPIIRQNLDELSALERLERRNTISLVFPEIGLGPTVSLSLDAIDIRDNERAFSVTKEALIPAINYRSPRMAPRAWPTPLFITTQLALAAEFNDIVIVDPAIKNNPSPLLKAPEGKSVAVAQRINFVLDFRDNPINATRGGLFTSGLEHVNAFPIGNAAFTSHFLRFTGRAAGYFRLTQRGMAIAVSVAAGYNLQLAKDSETYTDRLFFMGGIDSLRSFLAESLMPEDFARKIQKLPLSQQAEAATTYLRGGNFIINPRVELRIPITDLIHTGVFLDTGNLWADPSLIAENFAFRYALGAGVRFVTPIGPIAFDYGFNLTRREWEDIGAFHFAIGLF